MVPQGGSGGGSRRAPKLASYCGETEKKPARARKKRERIERSTPDFAPGTRSDLIALQEKRKNLIKSAALHSGMRMGEKKEDLHQKRRWSQKPIVQSE